MKPDAPVESPSSANRSASEPRRRRQALIRVVYLGLVIGFAVWLCDFFFGGYVYFRGEGLVVGQPSVVAAEFSATARDVLVKQGQRVNAGDVVATVSSQNVAETIARLSAELATRAARLSELRIRLRTVSTVIETAKKWQEVATDAREKLEGLSERGYLPVDKRSTVMESEFRSRQDLAKLRAEEDVLQSEMETLQKAFAEADLALAQLRNLYDDGRMSAPVDGVVSHVSASKGSVLRAGEPLLEIYDNQRFVLGYVPPGTLYDIYEGDEVVIKAGLQSFRGMVTRIQPLAVPLPREFQRIFTPVERQQVIRVDFAPGETPPLFTKVQLRFAHPLSHWTKQLLRR